MSALSRMFDYDDWGVTPEFFSILDRLWGPHTVDRFANAHNSKLPMFNSRYWNPGTSGVDALSFPWDPTDVNWVVPPPSLVSKVLRHMAVCHADGTLVVPAWTSAVFWPLIFPNSGSPATFVREFRYFSPGAPYLLPGSQYNSVLSPTRFTGALLAVRVSFSTNPAL